MLQLLKQKTRTNKKHNHTIGEEWETQCQGHFVDKYTYIYIHSWKSFGKHQKGKKRKERRKGGCNAKLMKIRIFNKI
jgi:hypothetical protein